MMKKVMALLLALLMVLSLAACGKTAEPAAPEEPEGEEEQKKDGDANMVNPWVEYTSLDDINGLAQGKLCAPAVMGVEDKYFAVLNDGEMAEYRFAVGGYEYNFRFACATTDDISGLWVANGTAFSAENAANIQNIDDMELVYTDTNKLARWMNIDGQYVLNVTDNGEMDEETFVGIAGELMTMTMTDMINANTEG